MQAKPIQELTTEAFAIYGSFGRMINPEAPKIGEKPIEFFRDMVRLDLGAASIASFSTCRVFKRPAVVDVTEFHTDCGEGMLPLDGDVLIHVAPACAGNEPPLDEVEIFRVPKGTMVAIHPGVWHHAPFAVEDDVANVLIVLPERTYANDCAVVELAGDSRIQIAGA